MSRGIQPCSLDEIIVSPPPRGKGPHRPAPAETDAFLDLSRTLSESPGNAAQKLVDVAMAMTGAGSAGLSLEEVDADAPVYRWIATTGELSRYVNGTMPRDYSPCGTAVDYRRPLLMREPVRYYAYVSQLHAHVSSVVLVPFARKGKLIGTVWVAAHTPEKVFDEGDIALVKRLTTFTSAVLDSRTRKNA
jgi:hypothetical protein